MCPECIASMALIVTGLTSTGGLTALVVEQFHSNNAAHKTGAAIQTGGEQNEHAIDRDQD